MSYGEYFYLSLDKWASSINVWDEKSGMFTTCLGGPGQSLGKYFLCLKTYFCLAASGSHEMSKHEKDLGLYNGLELLF